MLIKDVFGAHLVIADHLCDELLSGKARFGATFVITALICEYLS